MAAQALDEHSGKLFSQTTQVRVRYADTDQMKFVYYGKFFEYFEQGRSDLLRAMGLPYPEIEREGIFLPVIEAHAEYKQSARYDDLLFVDTILEDVTPVRIRIEYNVRREETGRPIVTGHTVHSYLNASTGRPTRLPARIKEVVERAAKRKLG